MYVYIHPYLRTDLEVGHFIVDWNSWVVFDRAQVVILLRLGHLRTGFGNTTVVSMYRMVCRSMGAEFQLASLDAEFYL